MNRAWVVFFGMLWTALGLHAQSDPPNVPILSGALAFIGSTTAGATTYQPMVAPVLVVPVGDKWLIESRAYVQGFFAREGGTTGPYNGHFFAGLDYLQVDYIVNSHLTITAGRFLTPFNFYNERLSPVWIANLEDSPIIFPIGTRTSASSNGGMLRGVAISRPGWSLNYTAYFSAASSVENLQSGRAAGGRAGVFFPHAGLEVGGSYQRFLQNGDVNESGAYVVWEPPQIPLDVRSEYAHSPGGKGYWLEGALRLAGSRTASGPLSRFQPVARVQQFFKDHPMSGDLLPSADVNQFDFGVNYYLPHDVRLNGSYGRAYSSTGNYNVWNFAVTYRFLFPAWPGEH